MYKKTVRGKERYLYYTEEEFRAYHPDARIVEWREGQTEDWVRSDDGQICEVFYTGKLTSGQGYLRTLLGSYIRTAPLEMRGDPPSDPYRIVGWKTPRERETNSTREKLFVKYHISGMPKEEAYQKAFPQSSFIRANRQSTLLLGLERIQKLVSKELESTLSAQGIDKESMVEFGKTKMEKCKNDSVQYKYWKDFVTMLGMFPETKKISESLTVFQGWDREDKKALESGEYKKLGTIEAEIDGRTQE